jgi:hypothetical protein
MSEEATGRVCFSNGIPVAGVRVRVFDRDIGSADDDLTLAEGVTDAAGQFRVVYDRSRAVDRVTITTTEPRSLIDWTLIQRSRTFNDPLDLYLPYLECRYMLRGAERRATFDLDSSPVDLRLPDLPPVAGSFVPSRHGFHFVNSFPGIPLPFSLPALPGIGQIPGYYGLCGGMSAAAADYLYAGKSTPPDREPPARRTALYQYLFRRQIDSFSPFGEPVMRFVKWMSLSERNPFGTWHRSHDEVEQLRVLFAAGVPAYPIGLVFANPGEPLWENHQVLAIGYREPAPQGAQLIIFEPNYP